MSVEGKVSAGSQPQSIYLYNYTRAKWDLKNSSILNTADSPVQFNVSNPGNYISGGKEPSSKDDPRAPLKRSDVKVIYESEPIAVLGEGEVEKVRVHDLNENEEYELFVDAVVILE